MRLRDVLVLPVQDVLSVQQLSCVRCPVFFVHEALRSVTVRQKEGTRLPTLIGDTRSSRAMHCSFRPLSKHRTVRSRGFPLSPLRIPGSATRTVQCVSLHPGDTLHAGSPDVGRR